MRSSIARLVSSLLLAACTLPLASCSLLNAVFQRPAVSLRNVELTSLSFQGISANFVLDVKNPNPIGLDLARLAYRINVDGHDFLDGGVKGALHVPAQGTGTIKVPVGIQFVAFAQSLAALFTKTEVPYSFATQLGFGTPAGVLDIPLSHSGSFPVPRLPSVSLSGARVSDVGLSGATLHLALGMQNHNQFAVPLGNLAYQVSIAGTPVISSSTAAGKLAAGASSPLDIAVRLDFVKLGLGIAQAVQSKSAKVALDGSLGVGSYAMPLHLAGTI